jgi:DNA-directed RNA polymerase subunit N (RpoN/RPB10)
MPTGVDVTASSLAADPRMQLRAVDGQNVSYYVVINADTPLRGTVFSCPDEGCGRIIGAAWQHYAALLQEGGLDILQGTDVSRSVATKGA